MGALVTDWLVAGLILAVAPWVLTTAHETAHLVMAVALRLRPASMSIGRGRQVFSFRLGRRRIPVHVRHSPWFGQVVVLPQPSPLIRLRLALFFIAGIVVNILVGLGCLVAAFGPWSLGSPGRVTLAMIGFYSVVIGATNAAPFDDRTTGSPLDGLQLLRLLLNRIPLERDVTHRPVRASRELAHSYEVEPRANGCVLTIATEYDAPPEMRLPADEQEAWQRGEDEFLRAVDALLESTSADRPSVVPAQGQDA